MSHIDLQQLIVFGIVALAALAIARRLWSQIMAFRRSNTGGGCSGCSGASKVSQSAAKAPQLLQIQVKPPAHLRRPAAK